MQDKFPDFWTSDSHFGHANMLNFVLEDGSPARPGFKNVGEMDREMIRRWNSVVGPDQVVVHLGDLSFDRRWGDRIMPQLQGRKYLVLGNHDRFKINWYAGWFQKIRGEFHFKSKDGLRIVATHFPIHPSCIARRTINVHGHIHSRNIEDPRYVNISVEQTDYTPVTIDFLWERAAKAYK